VSNHADARVRPEPGGGAWALVDALLADDRDFPRSHDPIGVHRAEPPPAVPAAPGRGRPPRRRRGLPSQLLPLAAGAVTLVAFVAIFSGGTTGGPAPGPTAGSGGGISATGPLVVRAALGGPDGLLLSADTVQSERGDRRSAKTRRNSAPGNPAGGGGGNGGESPTVPGTPVTLELPGGGSVDLNPSGASVSAPGTVDVTLETPQLPAVPVLPELDLEPVLDEVGGGLELP
jgi:hypothetical protein